MPISGEGSPKNGKPTVHAIQQTAIVLPNQLEREYSGCIYHLTKLHCFRLTKISPNDKFGRIVEKGVEPKKQLAVEARKELPPPARLEQIFTQPIDNNDDEHTHI